MRKLCSTVKNKDLCYGRRHTLSQHLDAANTSITSLNIFFINIQSIRRILPPLEAGINDDIPPYFVCLNEHWLLEEEITLYVLTDFCGTAENLHCPTAACLF